MHPAYLAPIVRIAADCSQEHGWLRALHAPVEQQVVLAVLTPVNLQSARTVRTVGALPAGLLDWELRCKELTSGAEMDVKDASRVSKGVHAVWEGGLRGRRRDW